LIYRVSEDFTATDINPITNKPYDNSWIVYCLTSSDEYHMMNGGGIKTVYTLKVSKNYPDWKMSIIDFIEFQEDNGKSIILSASNNDLELAKEFYLGHHYNEKSLRQNEPGVLIHSTTTENWESIKLDGCLKSWSVLKAERKDWEETPIGNELGDPLDFSDYIMFSNGAVSSEMVILSKQTGKINMNQNIKYKPGARLYFDMEKIAEDGLLLRDGCHLKVKGRLPLSPYLIWTADWKSVGLESEFSTPAEFTVRANNKFNELYGNTVKTTF